jgi:3-methyl-2-oxobutanoate hydroxymethyltransferase
MTLTQLRQLKKESKKITGLTAYDASFARLIEQANVDILLVGDSLGMVIQGHKTTLPVTVDDMIYHCQQVHRGCSQALLIVDMPFMSYATPDTALKSAARLMREGQAQMVKLEGGRWLVETVQILTERGIPVCAHLGLTPQSVHQIGGYRVQGKTEMGAACIRDDAVALQTAGASLLILECVPGNLAAEITALLDIPVIGIGAGVECDGQVLVLYDILGITPGKRPSFSKDFLQETGSIPTALSAFVSAVKEGTFPGPEHTF